MFGTSTSTYYGLLYTGSLPLCPSPLLDLMAVAINLTTIKHKHLGNSFRGALVEGEKERDFYFVASMKAS